MSALVARLRRAGAHPRIVPAVALLLRARTVRESVRFVVRELRPPSEPAVYRLRAGGRALIRHGTPDVVTLGEAFHETDYALPPEVSARLGEAPLALDLGANVGLFGLRLLAQVPQARMVAVEADPANAAVLRDVVARNGLEDRWQVVEAVAAAGDGEVAFRSGGYSLSRIGEGGQPTRALDVLDHIAAADLVKLDIEGGEWALLGDERFAAGRRPAAVVLEYHPHLCPGGDPRTVVTERLRALGFEIHSLWDRSDGHGMLWAWR